MAYRKNLALLLLAVRIQVRAYFHPTLRRFGLTEQQWRILRLLNESGPKGIGDIADACLILRPSIVGIIARMEDLDMVVRSNVAKDKRRVSIALTPHGALLVKKILPIFDGIYKEMEKRTGAARLNELYRILDHAHDHLATVATKADDD